MRFERYYIYVILTLALVLNWVVDGSGTLGKMDLNLGLLPKKSIIIIEMLQGLFLFYLLLKYKKYTFTRIAVLFTVVLIGFQFVVTIAVGNDITILISGVRYYFSFLPVMIVGYIYGAKGLDMDREFKWLLILIIIQIPISIWQFFVAKALILGTGQLFFDAIAGTMGGFAPNLMSMVTGIGIIYFLIRYIDERRVSFALIAMLLMIPSVISESKGMYIVLMVISVYLIRVSKLNLSRVIGMSAIIIILTFGYVIAYQSLDFGTSQAKGFELSFMLDYVATDSGRGRLSRIASIVYAINLIISEQSPLFGMGIGSANSNPIGPNPPYNDFFNVRHSVDILITEMGIIGVIMLIYFMFKVYKTAMKMIVKLPKDEIFKIRMAKLTAGLVLILSVGVLWEDILFRVQFMYPFGLLAGYIFGLNKNYNLIKKHSH